MPSAGLSTSASPASAGVWTTASTELTRVPALLSTAFSDEPTAPAGAPSPSICLAAGASTASSTGVSAELAEGRGVSTTGSVSGCCQQNCHTTGATIQANQHVPLSQHACAARRHSDQA